MMTKNISPLGSCARALFAVIALVFLALPAWAQSPYAGVYIGDVTDVPGTTNTGWFAIQVNGDNTAYAIFYDFLQGGAGDGGSADNIVVNPNGSFAFDLPHSHPDEVQPGRKVVGAFANNGVSGDVCDFTLNSGDPGCPGSGGNNPLVGKFSVSRSPATGLYDQFGGVYIGTLVGDGMESGLQVSAAGPIVAIADATGQAVILASPRLTLGATPQGVIDMAGLVQMDANTGLLQYSLSGGGFISGGINFLLTPPTGSGIWTADGAQRALSGTWTLARAYPLATAPDADIDITGISDISTDAVHDIAYLTTKNGQPFVRYYSGANRQQIRGQRYFGTAWAGKAAATVVDANSDGMANDPAVAVLGHKPSAGKHSVEVLRADDGTLIGRIDVLGPSWFVLDVAIINDKNGDGVTGDTLIAVLGFDLTKPFDQQIRVQVKRLSDGAVIANWYFFNGNWVPVALAAIDRLGQTPLLAVLANKPATGANVVQARKLTNGVKQRDTSFFNANKLPRDIAILLDSNGDGNANDPAYLVLANDIRDGKNKIQARRVSDGARLKNLTAVGINWEAKRVTSTGDISGNLIEEVGALAKKRTDGKIAIQLTDYDDRSTTATIFP